MQQGSAGSARLGAACCKANLQHVNLAMGAALLQSSLLQLCKMKLLAASGPGPMFGGALGLTTEQCEEQVVPAGVGQAGWQVVHVCP